MSAPIIAFFNNKGGVGKTSLVYHLSWMYRELGYNVVTADLDPQANLTSAFLSEGRLEQIFDPDTAATTIFDGLRPLIRGIGDIADPTLEVLDDRLALLVGDLELSGFEDELSGNWTKCLDRDERAFRVISAFFRLMQNAARSRQADIVLMDLGPNLGAINRAALIAADYVVIPLSPDLFSLQGLKNLGPTLRRWRDDWQERVQKNPDLNLVLPSGHMTPVGYVVMQHSVRLDRPVQAYNKWIDRIPNTYRQFVLNQEIRDDGSIKDDPHLIALVKHYRSLMAMAQEAQKPIFALKAADGAIGAHASAVAEAYQDFRRLARSIAQHAALPLPQSGSNSIGDLN